MNVRQLGMFLADPLDVPPELIDYLAEQLGIEDPSRVKQYTEREKTKLEHAWEIQREYGLTPYADVESELAAWVADQAWMTGDGPKAMFAGAVEWLRTRQALLPGPRTLERLVTDGRQAGDQRLWGQLTEQLPADTSSALLSETVAHAGTCGRNTQLVGRKRFGRDDARADNLRESVTHARR
jgi:hypothetical protein